VVGSCQLFLPLSDADIEKNYSSGHVCGDDLGKFKNKLKIHLGKSFRILAVCKFYIFYLE
jgi:hypothetical protein